MTDKTDREIMQMALEALEVLTDNYDDNAVGIEIDAIIALRERLAQPEQEPVLQDIEQYRMQMASISTAAIGYWKEGDGIHPDYDTPALRDVAMLYAKYDALYKAQPEQDPVAYVIRTLSGKSISDEIAPTRWSTFESKIEKLRADPWVQNGIAEIIPLYTAPQKREWQGLTDEEYNRLVMEHLGPHALTGGKISVYDAFLLAIRATEAKLKEKND